MIESIKFYGSDDVNSICVVKSKNNKSRIFTCDKEYVLKVISKYKLKPSKKTDNYTEYNSTSLKNLDKEDHKIINRMLNKSKNVKVSRKKSSRTKKQYVGAISIAAIISLEALATGLFIHYIYNLGNDKEIVSESPIDDDSIDIDIDIELDTDSTNTDTNTNFDTEIEEEIETETKEDNELDNNGYSIFSDANTFEFSFIDRSTDQCVENSSTYMHFYKKYGDVYGIDPLCLMAIAAQESSGIHRLNNDETKAVGLMQIYKPTWLNKEVEAYNMATETFDKELITIDKLNDVEYNIKIATMIFQTYLHKFDYNIPIALQAYNAGENKVNLILDLCASNTRIDKKKIIKNQSINTWLNYSHYFSGFDQEYPQHIFSFIPNKTTLKFMDREFYSRIVTTKNTEVDENYIKM